MAGWLIPPTKQRYLSRDEKSKEDSFASTMFSFPEEKSRAVRPGYYGVPRAKSNREAEANPFSRISTSNFHVLNLINVDLVALFSAGTC